MTTLDELLARDKQRKEDGFKQKIRIGRIVKPEAEARKRLSWFPLRWRKSLFMRNLILTGNRGKETRGRAPEREKRAMLSPSARPS